MNMKEYWVDIKEYEGLYQVSNYGRIRSLDRMVTQLGANGKQFSRPYYGTILKPRIPEGMYPYVHLSKDGKRKTKKIHRLVAENMIDNPEKLAQVNHIDGDKENNYVENLEWCSDSYNKLHAIKLGLKVNPKGKKAHHYRGDVYVYKDGNLSKDMKTSQIKDIHHVELVLFCQVNKNTTELVHFI